MEQMGKRMDKLGEFVNLGLGLGAVVLTETLILVVRKILEQV